VNADTTRNADVRVVGETIAEVGSGLRPSFGARSTSGDVMKPGIALWLHQSAANGGKQRHKRRSKIGGFYER